MSQAFAAVKAGEESLLCRSYSRYPVAVVRGKGARLWDVDGKEYVDLLAGIAVTALGHCNDEVNAALTAQAEKLWHVSNLFYQNEQLELARVLLSTSHHNKAFFCNSGAEANEGAIKLARKYSFDKYGAGRNTIVTLNHSFHGRTITTLAATGQDVFHQYFFPFTEGFVHAEPNDVACVKSVCSSGTVCAVLMELIQGEGGVLPLDQAFVQEVAAFCKSRDILLLVDEVQTGVGRTGTLFCYQQYGIAPDAVTFAKGIAAGLPFGGVLAADNVASVLSAGTHATTFGGNPICAAGANAVLSQLTPDFLKDVSQKGAYIRETIAGWILPVVSSVRGLGLMIGIGVTCSHREAVGKMIESGLLALTAGSDTIRLMPPLTITKEEIDAGLAILKKILSAY